MITLIVFAKVKPGCREELLETGRVLFNELSKEPTFLDAWLHTTEDDPDLIVVYERWNETKESFVRDLLPKLSHAMWAGSVCGLVAVKRGVTSKRGLLRCGVSSRSCTFRPSASRSSRGLSPARSSFRSAKTTDGLGSLIG